DTGIFILEPMDERRHRCLGAGTDSTEGHGGKPADAGVFVLERLDERWNGPFRPSGHPEQGCGGSSTKLRVLIPEGLDQSRDRRAAARAWWSQSRAGRFASLVVYRLQRDNQPALLFQFVQSREDPLFSDVLVVVTVHVAEHTVAVDHKDGR